MFDFDFDLMKLIQSSFIKLSRISHVMWIIRKKLWKSFELAGLISLNQIIYIYIYIYI